MDIVPELKRLARPGVEILIGDQADPSFWAQVKEQAPVVDIFIDDGGHTMEQQLVTFREMWPHIRDGGVFACEDTHTSYYGGTYGGGVRKPGTFIERAKLLVDDMNAWHCRDDDILECQVSREDHPLLVEE